MPSIREAVFTVSPITAYSSRRSEPTLPDITGPELIADPHPEPVADAGGREPSVERGELLAQHRARRGHRPVRVVLRGHRRPERRHHAVAHVVDERATVVQDRVGHQAQVVVEHVDHLVDRKGLRERREPSEIPEQHGPRERLRGDRAPTVGPIEQRTHQRLGHEAREHAAHPLLLEVVQRLTVQAGVHARPKDHGVERLGQEVLGTHLDASDDALRVIDAADHDHGQVAELFVAFDALQHLHPVHAGHDEIEQDDIGTILSEHGQRRLSVFGG